MKNTLLDITRRDGTRKLFASLLSIVIGITVGALMVLLVGLIKGMPIKGIFDGVQITLYGILCTGRGSSGNLSWGYNAASLGDMLFRATPLVLTGLSVAVANKAGLFNIGAPGQYLMGTLASLFICLGLAMPEGNALPAWLIWMLAFLGGAAAGAIWGAIPGLLKAFLNINEVLACIMTNWLAANIVTWAFDESNFKNMLENTKSGYVYKTETFGVATSKMGLDKLFPGSQVNGGILIAIIIAVAMYILVNKTTLGYQLKACGANRHAARYAGINDKRNIVLSMAIAGGLAAAGASLYWLSGNTEFSWNTYQALPAEGFNGISVALLAINNPIGCIFSGIFMAMLDVVGNNLSGFTAYNEYITDVIVAIIVYLSAFSLVLQMWLGGKKKKEKASKANTADEKNADDNKEGGAQA